MTLELSLWLHSFNPPALHVVVNFFSYLSASFFAPPGASQPCCCAESETPAKGSAPGCHSPPATGLMPPKRLQICRTEFRKNIWSTQSETASDSGRNKKPVRVANREHPLQVHISLFSVIFPKDVPSAIFPAYKILPHFSQRLLPA